VVVLIDAETVLAIVGNLTLPRLAGSLLRIFLLGHVSLLT
jgi:hypothetical protein